MAVGFILAKQTCSWAEVNNPAFVFTSPNMDQGVAAGTRSHIVPEEMPLALWLEDSDRNVMNRIMIDQDTLEYCSQGHYGHFLDIFYDDYQINRYRLAKDFTSYGEIVYLIDPVNIDTLKFYMSDTFDGPNVDTSKWYVNSGSNGSIGIVDGKLSISLPKIDSYERPYCSTVELFSGNFELEVELDVDVTNASQSSDGPEVRIVYDTGSYSFVLVRVTKDNIIGDSSDGSATSFKKYFDSVVIRFVREGSVIKAYVAQGNSSFREYFVFNNITGSTVKVELSMWAESTVGAINGYFDNFIIADRLDVFLPQPSNYDNRFYCVSHSPEVTNWFKLNDNPPDYIDSIGNISLTSSGVLRVMDNTIHDYTASFDVGSIMYSTTAFDPTDEFSVSLFVDNNGLTCGSESEFFGECQTFVNLYGYDGTYFSIGTTDSNTLYYKVKTNISTFSSDTGITMTSGILEHVSMTCSSGTGIKFYYNGDKVSEVNTAIGTVSSGVLSFGNINQGVGSKFKGRMSDVKLVSSGILTDGDNKAIYDKGPINSLDYALYGFSVGGIDINTGDYIYYKFPHTKNDLLLSSSLHIIIKFGEAYNCYITAWDDTSHTTTTNSVFVNNVLKLSATVFRSKDTSGFPGYYTGELDETYIVYSSVSDMPIKGNDYYFGKFNVVYFIGNSYYVGDVISFRPRISKVTKAIFPPGNYDFVITFHYQYT